MLYGKDGNVVGEGQMLFGIMTQVCSQHLNIFTSFCNLIGNELNTEQSPFRISPI